MYQKSLGEVCLCSGRLSYPGITHALDGHSCGNVHLCVKEGEEETCHH